ncbi:hypothetical protein SLE2022_302680 [Rubroshorea leprosula]
MASDHQQRNNGFSMFKPKVPHFFKIILEVTTRERKLRIPRNFLRKYGNGMSSPVVLKVPSGAAWEVGLAESEGDVWLQNGWKEFADHYCLNDGHFLVFRFEGNCNFHVLIFDKSGSEIEYPHGHVEDSRLGEEFQEPTRTESEDYISVEALLEIPPCRKVIQQSPVPCPRPCKKMRTNSTEEYKFNPMLGKRDGSGSFTGHGGIQVPKRMEKKKAIEMATAYKSKNPFVLVAIQPSCITPGYRIKLPGRFLKKHLMKNVCDIILHTLDGKTWSARLSNDSICKGWRAFVLDNNLEVGDVCVFELIRGTEYSFKVVIYRIADNSSFCSSLVDKSGGKQVKPQKSSEADTNCDFMNNDGIGLVSPHKQGAAKESLVPKTEQNENDASIEILDDFSSFLKTRKKSYLRPPRPAKKMNKNPRGNRENLPQHHGYKDIQSMGMKMEKSMKNEHSDNAMMGNEVALYSPAKDDGARSRPAQRGKKDKEFCFMPSLHCKERAKAPTRARDFISESPFSMVVLQPSHIYGGSLALPFPLMRKFINQETGSWMLEVKDRTWPVKLIIPHQSVSSVRFSAGWPAFARDNSLKAGDTCVFEIIEESNATIKVSIFRT